jgi:hypothetical protein
MLDAPNDGEAAESRVLRGLAYAGKGHVVEVLRHLLPRPRHAVEQFARRVLRDGKLMKDEDLRSGAVALVVGLLPRTFPLLRELFADKSTDFWYEAHFTTLVLLDRRDLTEGDQRRVVHLVGEYLRNIRSPADHAAWKAGDFLGDHWRDGETIAILKELVLSARYVAGREGALHGIREAVADADKEEGVELLGVARLVAVTDRSRAVRSSARFLLREIAGHARPRERREGEELDRTLRGLDVDALARRAVEVVRKRRRKSPRAPRLPDEAELYRKGRETLEAAERAIRGARRALRQAK